MTTETSQEPSKYYTTIMPVKVSNHKTVCIVFKQSLATLIMSMAMKEVRMIVMVKKISTVIT